MLTENDIAQISRRIVAAYNPLVVGTFGSYAVRGAHDRSDLDLFLITETSNCAAKRMGSIRRVLFGVLYPLDIHVFSAEEFEQSAYRELSFTWIIAKQARLYHWTEKAKQAVPSLLPRAAE